MLPKNLFWFFKKAIPTSQVNKIIKICEKEKLDKANVHHNGKDIIENKTRDCDIRWTNDNKIYDIINPYINTANKNAEWNYQIDWNETCQYTVYNKSQFYGYHVDSFQSPYTKHPNPNYLGKIRKLSMTLQLSNKSDYTGGDFYFKYLTKDGVVEQKLKDAKTKGTLIIFPSYMLHQVTPVTKGTRKSLVCWTLGFPFK
jgi:PKHD-type hydroxylase